MSTLRSPISGWVLAGVSVLTLFIAVVAKAQDPPKAVAAADIQAAQKSYEEQLKAEENARKRDPAWKPQRKEVLKFNVGKGGTVNNFCVNNDGNLLVCVGGDRMEYYQDPKTNKLSQRVVKASAEIATYSPAGTKLKSLKVTVKPTAICVLPDGTIYYTGMGHVVKMNQAGKVLLDTKIPGFDNSEMSGIAATGNDIFVVGPSPNYSFGVTRFDHNLKNPKVIIKGLAGCCGQMDIQTYQNELWVAHNARHSVERYDRDGKKLFNFGKSDRKAASGFGGCCEPKNLRFGKNGVMFAAESGPPTVIKSFDRNGKFLGVVALPSSQSGCVRTTVDISKDGKTVFVINADEGDIHVIR